jgi:hypothetical protein
LNLEKMQNEEFKSTLGALLDDFKNLPANIASLIPPPAVKGLLGDDVKSIEANAEDLAIINARERFNEIEALRSGSLSSKTFKQRAEEIAHKLGATIDISEPEENILEQMEQNVLNLEAESLAKKNEAIRETELKDSRSNASVRDDASDYLEAHRKKRTIVNNIDETVSAALVPTISDLNDQKDITYTDAQLQELLRLHNSPSQVATLPKQAKKLIYSLYRDRTALPAPASLKPDAAEKIAAKEGYEHIKSKYRKLRDIDGDDLDDLRRIAKVLLPGVSARRY